MRGLVRVSICRGISLIELLVAVVIMMMIAGATSRLLVRSWQSEEVTNDQNLAQKTAQVAVDAVVDRIRGAAGIASGDQNEITVAFGNGDTLTYRRQEHALQRSRYTDATGETTTETPVPDLLTGLSFEYRQRDGAGWKVADTASVADLVVVSVSATAGRCLATETSYVKLRNKT